MPYTCGALHFQASVSALLLLCRYTRSSTAYRLQVLALVLVGVLVRGEFLI